MRELLISILLVLILALGNSSLRVVRIDFPLNSHLNRRSKLRGVISDLEPIFINFGLAAALGVVERRNFFTDNVSTNHCCNALKALSNGVFTF
jgi:hypothetical protein